MDVWKGGWMDERKNEWIVEMDVCIQLTSKD